MPDIVYATTLYTMGNKYQEHVYRAFSGIDGHEIWSFRDSLQGQDLSRWNIWGPDVNQDGFPDIVGTANNLILGIDGQTGSLILQGSERLLEDVYPSPAYLYSLTFPLFLTGTAGSPAGEELVALAHIWEDRYGLPDRAFSELVYIDPTTFQRIDHIPFPTDLMPWSPDLVVDPSNTTFNDNWTTSLGDIDRDGFTELARVSRALSVPGPEESQHLSIMGQRTLWVPAQAQAGTTVDLTVSIPSSPGRSFHTLLSTAFDGDGGTLLADRWPTFLAPSFLLSQTLPGQFYRGVLDTAGEATLSIQLPPPPALVGQTLYSRVVVEEPGEPGDVWTLSSLGVTEILP
ncbi:MAG: hypothetical protein D6702_12485 [Planctomycetota bacterium]|nr:MAG: hypothetical protein D6702_12485 [Planctomycetota bacterium]